MLGSWNLEKSALSHFLKKVVRGWIFRRDAMEESVHIFRQVLSPVIVKSVLEDMASLTTDDYPEDPFSGDHSKIVACSCRLCAPEVLRTCGDSSEPCVESISTALSAVRRLLGSVPETHCINRLASGSQHL